MLVAPPAEDLGGSLALCVCDLDQGRIPKGLSVPEAPVGLEDDALLLKFRNGVFSVQKGIDLDLVHNRELGDLVVLLELEVVLPGVIADADPLDLAGGMEVLEFLVGGNVLARYRPVDEVSLVRSYK